MKRTHSRLVRFLTVLATAAVAAGALVACGDGDDDGPQQLSFKTTALGTISGPAKAQAGLAKITFANNGPGPADLQLIRTEGDHAAKEVIEGLEDGVSGKPLPDWFFAGGGIGLTQEGDTDSATQILQPGTYYAFNVEGRLNPETTPVIEVEGEASEEELEGGAATVEASEYAFKSGEALPSGTNEILFENVGAQPHHMIATKLTGDATAEDLEKVIKSNKGQPPIDEKTTQATAVVEGGNRQLVSFDLEPGRYAFYCFITDRQGGPPHAVKGMVDEIEVK